MSDNRTPIKRALISVYDKTGLEELAQALGEAGVEIVSTGSTAARIAEAGVQVTQIEQLTGFPECLEGRVKTLHPRVHAGILADTRKPDHLNQLEELEVEPFQLVVVNLYPFAETVASGASYDDCVEQIDIGGPSMVRAAAKNHPSVAVVTSPERYAEVIDAVKGGGFDLEQRKHLALEAFRHTASYDVAVSTWLGQQLDDDNFFGATYQEATPLRYGENPHQSAKLYSKATGLAGATQLGGKEMSYNNYQDADAAWRAAWDHERACVAIIKHANPCGIGVSDSSIAEAHKKAHACDPMSAYGGVVASNREVTVEFAEQIKPIFTEVVIAPSYEPAALEILKEKKNLRVLEAGAPSRTGNEFKQISGGLLVQERDFLQADGDDAANWELVAGEPADAATLADLQFAWNAIRCVKSNAILIAHEGATVGVGMGQVNRVDSAKLAVERANTLDEGKNRTNGAVAASDAFFPFADGFQVLADAGVTAVVQPGGSIRDDEVIAAAKDAGVTMYLTGTRHFAH
ncbi:bifunctional phosphoribosylaminoimidazolecarboxamide formyltransferase/IMP cyclohydrolase [Corynebacterium cystitidis]|uniref:Bifunctional purine biosynthesis protein PurH n=1 Tax=Corynebacterium cystitidis DSM 20524 TaxID=1121357 RepID=A0A1H9TVU9_9CORY|nr:bifunctional phosphoribosylaminoimidazolecarboxamide formyltransferase/IMP cyclohydrolase [Corynebacterium cystitidis]WJY81917.1 Bifunctional purine biosynthesis protein PurH [Corynebacterium cystitidis DSM 20524]SES01500.1 phosphoribosylaminoimidazolecarboxamide formyltransferase / IMP cyclohydrolase [Corynebacterium cystitidis DSM 20524]SNV82080.1 bifunctional phosphoribosylaminoimidazolecarboxamide formyltransferase/IMP cyclohydrolase [Corynebacterium cystitidis]